MASEAPKSPELSAEFGAKEQEIQKFKKEKLKIDEKEADKDIIKEENLDKESDRIAAEIEEAKKVLDPVYADKLTAKLDNIITGAKTELTGRLKTINQGSEKTLKEIYDRTWDRLKGFDRDPEVAVLKLFADKKNDIAQIPEMQITTYKSGSGFYKVINGKLAEKDITENAIKMAQKILGITVDGKVGPQTIMALSKMLMFRSDVKFGNKTITSESKELDEQGKVVEPKQKKEKAEKPKAAKAPEKPTAPPAAAQPASGPPPATPEKTAPEEPDRQKAEAEKTEGDIGLLRKDLEARKTEFTGENLQKSILEKLTIKKTPPEITAAIKQKITDAKFDKTMADMLAKTESQLNIADASEDPAAVGLLLGEVKMSMLSLTIKSFLQTPEVKALTGRLEGPMNKVNELMEKYPDKKYSKEKNILIQKIIEFIMNESRTLDIASLEENFQKTEEQKPSTPEPRPAKPESEDTPEAAARAPERLAESPSPAKTVPIPPTSAPPEATPPPQPEPQPPGAPETVKPEKPPPDPDELDGGEDSEEYKKAFQEWSQEQVDKNKDKVKTFEIPRDEMSNVKVKQEAQKYLREIKKLISKGVTAVEFSAHDCPGCKEFKPFFYQTAGQGMKFKNQDIKFVNFNMRSMTDGLPLPGGFPKIGSSFPVILVFEDGKPIIRYNSGSKNIRDKLGKLLDISRENEGKMIDEQKLALKTAVSREEKKILQAGTDESGNYRKLLAQKGRNIKWKETFPGIEEVELKKGTAGDRDKALIRIKTPDGSNYRYFTEDGEEIIPPPE